MDPRTKPDHTAIADADAQRRRAMVDGDCEMLGELLADDLVYVHSNSEIDSKLSYLTALRTDLRYRRAVVEESTIRQYGEVGVMSGHVALEVEVKGARRSLHNSFVSVWARRDGNWQMVHWQSTPVPGASTMSTEGTVSP